MFKRYSNSTLTATSSSGVNRRILWATGGPKVSKWCRTAWRWVVDSNKLTSGTAWGSYENDFDSHPLPAISPRREKSATSQTHTTLQTSSGNLSSHNELRNASDTRVAPLIRKVRNSYDGRWAPSFRPNKRSCS